jgi:predicted sugar kinase
VASLKAMGVPGAGQSSWGPGVFGVTDAGRAAWVAGKLGSGAWVAKGRNGGARIDTLMG